MTAPGLTLAERLMLHVEVADDGCWIYTGHLNRGGYGSIAVRTGIPALAHRVSYEHHVGPIPDGLQLDHQCRNRACVNPRHLEPVTCRENVRRGVLARGYLQGAIAS